MVGKLGFFFHPATAGSRAVLGVKGSLRLAANFPLSLDKSPGSQNHRIRDSLGWKGG